MYRWQVSVSDWRCLVVWDHWEPGALPVSVSRQPVSVLQCLVWSQLGFTLFRAAQVKLQFRSNLLTISTSHDKSVVFALARRAFASNQKFLISTMLRTVQRQITCVKRKWYKRDQGKQGNLTGHGEEKEVEWSKVPYCQFSDFKVMMTKKWNTLLIICCCICSSAGYCELCISSLETTQQHPTWKNYKCHDNYQKMCATLPYNQHNMNLIKYINLEIFQIH